MRLVVGDQRKYWVYESQLRIAAELDVNGQVVSRFIYGNGHSPEAMVKAGITYKIITDQLGSVRMVINSTSGEIAQRIEYDDFGAILLDTNPGFQPFGFAGGLYDNDTKLIRFGARNYDAETGRWLSQDPTGFAGGDTNLYVYVGNDPVNRIDPTGLVDDARVAMLIALYEKKAALLGVKGLSPWSLIVNDRRTKFLDDEDYAAAEHYLYAKEEVQCGESPAKMGMLAVFYQAKKLIYRASGETSPSAGQLRWAISGILKGIDNAKQSSPVMLNNQLY